jgi:hypothetical protein
MSAGLSLHPADSVLMERCAFPGNLAAVARRLDLRWVVGGASGARSFGLP